MCSSDLKKLLVLMTCLALMSMMVAPVLGADSVVKVEVDGQLVQMDVQPFVNADNRTLVQLRAPMEAMGATVSWDQPNQVASIVKGDVTIAFTVGQKAFTVNGVSTNMDTAAVFLNGRVMIPIKYAAEALGATVAWNGETKTVGITSAVA